MSDSVTVQRSFRLSVRTSELLNQAASSANESRNGLADRLLSEALRTDTHPLVRFRKGAKAEGSLSLLEAGFWCAK